jgi:hypothetical protein
MLLSISEYRELFFSGINGVHRLGGIVPVSTVIRGVIADLDAWIFCEVSSAESAIQYARSIQVYTKGSSSFL